MLRTILHSFYDLLGAVSENIPVDDSLNTAYQEDAMFMSEIAYSFLDIVNSYRPMQASQSATVIPHWTNFWDSGPCNARGASPQATS